MESVCSSEIPPDADLSEVVVCQSDKGVEGQMKEVEMDGYKILLIREKGELRALSALCTHYGAPLIKGAHEGGGSIKCPWRGACFNTKTGGLS